MTDKSDGIFLWARIALQDLVTGILAKDTLEVLTDRLEHLSGSLNGLFAQLLDRIHPLHRASAANYLRFEDRWSKYFEGAMDLTLLDMAFACEEWLGEALLASISTIDEKSAIRESADESIAKLYELRMWLIGCCAGLLDVNIAQRSSVRHWVWHYHAPMATLTRRQDTEMSKPASDLFNLQVCSSYPTFPRDLKHSVSCVSVPQLHGIHCDILNYVSGFVRIDAHFAL